MRETRMAEERGRTVAGGFQEFPIFTIRDRRERDAKSSKLDASLRLIAGPCRGGTLPDMVCRGRNEIGGCRPRLFALRQCEGIQQLDTFENSFDIGCRL